VPARAEQCDGGSHPNLRRELPVTPRLLLVPLVAGVATSAVMPSVLRLLRARSILDHPTYRSSHRVPVLRGGGIAVVVGLVAGLLVATPPLRFCAGLLTAALAFGLIGLTEDLFGIPPLRRFLLQSVAGSVVAVLLAASGVTPLLLVSLVGLWIVSYTNAFNFMDGIDGISAAQALVAGISYAGLGAWAHKYIVIVGGLSAAGAAAGFAPWNVPVARVFLGDVGSYALGAFLATLGVLALRSGATVEAAAAPVAVYLADTGTTLLRRMRSGKAWYLPHRTHIYQRLTDLGWSHQHTAALVGAIAACCTGLGLATLNAAAVSRALADGALAVLLVGYLALPRLATRVPASGEA
jgi:UDP-GlcNAc:undecaprenyl-phosphate GlcNAc-1-phosphate transferase